MDRVKLEVQARDERGGKAARAIRAAGSVPGVIYRAGADSTAIAVDGRALRQAVSGPGGMYALLDVTVDGDKRARTAIIKDLQLDPVRDRVIHIDLHEIPLDQKIGTVVQVHLEGEPEGVGMGGVLSQPTHELRISVLPTEIPEVLQADVSALQIGDALRLSDLTVPEGVEVIDDPDTVIATVTAPIAEEELEPEVEEGEEGEEGAEGAEAQEGEGGEAEEGGAPAAEDTAPEE
jgi:large subunit ribosomal protein L25